MTRSTSARLAGFAFLIYIVVGVLLMVIGPGEGEGTAARLADLASHQREARVALLLSPILWISALVLAVTLYAITREVDRDLALMVLVCRAGEGIVGAAGTLTSLSLLWLATEAGAAADTTLGSLLFRAEGWNVLVSALLFALGSAVFSWLLVRGRLVPLILAWLGVVASVLLVVALPLRMAGLIEATVVSLLWIPMALFEIPLAVWLIVKGVAPPRHPA